MPSKAIRDVSYDEMRNELTVTFVRGNTYVYSLVPPAVAAAFAASEARGVFHNEEIRDRYPFRRVKTDIASGGVSLRAMLTGSLPEDSDRENEPRVSARR